MGAYMLVKTLVAYSMCVLRTCLYFFISKTVYSIMSNKSLPYHTIPYHPDLYKSSSFDKSSISRTNNFSGNTSPWRTTLKTLKYAELVT